MEAVRSSKLLDAVNDTESERLWQEDFARRDLRSETRREALRLERARERQAERERFRQELRDLSGCADLSDCEEGSESEPDRESDYDFEEFGDERDTDHDDHDVEAADVSLRHHGSHAELLCKAARHMQKGEGGIVDLARSAHLCAMALSLEVDLPAGEFCPEYSTFGRAMAALRALVGEGGVKREGGRSAKC